MHIILDLKHWQLFLMWLAPTYMLRVFIPEQGNCTPFVAISAAYFYFIFMNWLYHIGKAANDRLPIEFKVGIRWLNFVSVFSYLAFMIVIFLGCIDLKLSEALENHPSVRIVVVFAFAYSVYYALYYASRQFTVLQRQSYLQFFDFAGTFLLMCVPPVGIWFLQPKVNRLLGNKSS